MRGRFRLIPGGKVLEDNRVKTGAQLRPLRFEDVFLSHLDDLYSFALRLLGGRREFVEDLVQETCLRAFRAYENLRCPEKVKHWIIKILVNTYINHYQHEIRKTPIVDIELSENLLSPAHVPAVPTPEEELFNGLLGSDIREALDSLPVEFREVVWLADVEELSYLEIAEIVHCSPGTVASRLYRGHSLLREHLREFARQRGLLKD